MKDYSRLNHYNSIQSRLLMVYLDDDCECIPVTSFYRHYLLGRINAALSYYAFFNPFC